MSLEPIRRRIGGVVSQPPMAWWLGLYSVLLVLSALDAYTVGHIPLPWVAEVGSIVGLGYLAIAHSLGKPLGRRSLWILLFWSALVTAANTLLGHYAALMPAGATTPYLVFVSLRVLAFVSFAASLYFVYWLLQHSQGERVIKITLLVASVVSVAAIYIYLAQLNGWPEPPRSRMGTSGGFQPIRFTYDFHRATGTFREPGFLGAWLVMPFFLSMATRGPLAYAQAILIGGVILLTGSLAAIAAVAVALIVLISGAVASRSKATLGLLWRLVTLPPALALFYLLAKSNTPSQPVNLGATIANRVEPIVTAGPMHSDRYYIYNYVIHNWPPLFGSGFGNANIVLSQQIDSHLVVGFISIYLNTLYAAGVVGLGILAWFLLVPVARFLINKELRSDGQTLLVMAPYLGWLVLFGVSVEEFGFMFALVAAFASYQILDRHRVLPPSDSPSPVPVRSGTSGPADER